MEITVFPQGFNVQPSQVPGPTGPVDGMQLIMIDVSGIALRVTFPLEAWQQFRRFVDDPEGESERAAARAKIVGPVPLPPGIRGGPH